MWVRIQDKKRLIKVDNVVYKHYINGSKPNHDIETGTTFGLIKLGSYSTKEKALKVLDMIQEHILIEKTDVVVFQMPLDSEV